jgi:DNA topoisomerase-1
MKGVVAARIRYARDDRPGLSRSKRGRGFLYTLPDGRTVRDPATLARIRTLAVPPAWTNVWIARDPRGHLQATGRDARGRKQYRYHRAWTAVRDANKYEHLIAFARCLPAIRHKVARDLAAPPLSRKRVLATVITLLERTHIRVGNDEYARANRSYGLTTLENRHVRVRGRRVEFRFKGKSGVHHQIALDDPRLAREVRRCQELPGQTLFEYRDASNRTRRVGSSDVNAYLAAVAAGVSAKDFRTWWGTVSAAILLREAGAMPTARARKRAVLSALDEIATQLGNTRAVCRKGYVHPQVLAAYERQIIATPRSQQTKGLRGLSADEHAVVALLERMRRVDSKTTAEPAGAPARSATRSHSSVERRAAA